MSDKLDDTTTRLARRVRLEREARGWSLAELAERSGVAKASLSRIEREEMSPTAALLVRIAAAFELTLAGLLLRAEGEGSRLVRAASQPVWTDPGTGYVRRQLFARPDHPLEAVRVELPPGRAVTLPAASYAYIRQILWVMDGRLVLHDGAERHEMAAGDCFGFGPPVDVTLANEAAAPCIYLVALTRS